MIIIIKIKNYKRYSYYRHFIYLYIFIKINLQFILMLFFSRKMIKNFYFNLFSHQNKDEYDKIKKNQIFFSDQLISDLKNIN